MNVKYLLQQYEDGTFGYYFYDGDNYCNYKTGSKIIHAQNINEDRDDFISKNSITFASNQYGSNLKLDRRVNDEDPKIRAIIAEQGYGLEKLINDENYEVRAAVARKGYGLDKLINDKNSWWVSDVVADYLNSKADDNFIINLGNKLLDKGYKLSTNNIKLIFTDETCTKFKEFRTYKEYELIYQVLARLLWKNIRVKEIYDPNYPVIVKLCSAKDRPSSGR